MTYSIETQGADRLASLFGALETEVARAQVNAINAGATEFRRGFVDDIHQATGLKKKLLRERIRIRRAKQANPQARLVPDSQGLPITEYVWRPEPAGHPTRARILIRWFGGWKVAAGFVNPEADTPLPMKTITSRGRLRRPVLAHGISVAAAFKVARDDGRLDRYGARLAEIFEDKLADQLARRRNQ
ncbi:phage tail protein [Marinobacter sp. UBA2498]|jgi:hypothetical protein|uniref:phage tail protein n=1 Tax=Marinobacter sp. UBA2498 TaxID=1946813 RepID=UPI00257B8159|nr:phage tail protein [Marinobacter sp. UBA2498]|tara:strand:+ start:7305 stop:7865 length:561 start_codon:yes stop_codon:yes gene_type:complete